MTDDNQRALAETVFEREQRREKEISDALKMEAERHEHYVWHETRKSPQNRAGRARYETRKSVGVFVTCRVIRRGKEAISLPGSLRAVSTCRSELRPWASRRGYTTKIRQPGSGANSTPY